MDDSIEPLLTAARIEARVGELAREIGRDLRGRDPGDAGVPLFIGVLTGAWMFMADLVRRLDREVQCDFVRLASYRGRRRGDVTLHSAPRADCRGRDVVLVEDVVDTGASLQWLLNYFAAQAASVRVVTLLDKPARRRVQARADYVGFTIADRFVVGYGLDCDERWRQLPFVGVPRERRAARAVATEGGT